MKIRYSCIPWRFYLLAWLLIPCLSNAQNPEGLLRAGRLAYETDQLDTARWYYQQAYRMTDPNIQLQALGGLVSLEILRSDLNAADSLVRLGDDLTVKYDLELSALCYYLIRKGEYLRSSSRFPEALAQHQEVIRLSAVLPDSTLLFADALYYTGLTFEQLSAYDSSLTYVERAFELYQQELDTTSIKFGNICNGLGVCYYRAGHYEAAKKFYLKSKEIAEQQLGLLSIDLANAWSNLSAIYRAEENYQEAIAASERALKVYRALEDEGRVSSAYYSLGVYHYFLGDYGPAKSYLEACIEIRERLYEPLHYSLVGPYEVLGIVFEESGDYDQTLYYLRKARPIILHNYGPGNITEAFNYENTAICHQNRGELDSALVYIKRSNRILEPFLSGDDYSLGVHYFNFANIHYLLMRIKS